MLWSFFARLRNMDTRMVVAISIAIGVVAALVAMVSWPTSIPLSILNSGDSGLSSLYSRFKPMVILSEGDLYSISPDATLLLVVAEKPLSHSMAQALIDFASRGGTVVVSGGREAVASLLSSIFTTCSPAPYRVYDPLFNVGWDKRLVRVLVPELNSTVVLESPFLFTNCSDSEVYALSGSFSYVDANGNGFYDAGEEVGSRVLGVSIGVGRGRMVVFASPTIFLNRYFDYNWGVITHLAEKGFGIAVLQSIDVVELRLELLRIYLVKVGLNTVLPYIIALAISAVVVYAWWREHPE